MTTIEFPAPLTPRAAKILASASEVARSMGAATYIGVEHIFSAIVREGESVPAQVMRSLGYEDAIVSELERVLASASESPWPS
jgi:ATP-dependent Clp protease ATP-binding subunit ClpA